MYKDKAKQKQYQRIWYQANHERIRVEQAAYRKENKPRLLNWFTEYKKTLKCEKCGEDHPACLHFHHRDPSQKRFTISAGIRLAVCRKEIMNEIAKCSVLCANCHAKHHASTVTMPTLGT